MKLRVLLLCALLAGCAGLQAPSEPDGWHGVSLPGKAPTRYAADTKDGRPAIAARADRSASLWRRHVDVLPEKLGMVDFSWWVQGPVPGADLGDAEREDAPARVLFAFDGDHGRLTPRNRMLFDLAQLMTGERPPFATLMYVYGNASQPGTVLIGNRTDRIRKIVVDAGEASSMQWRMHRRDLVADFRHAFGEAPGRLISIAVMTDTDNTGGQASAWYGPVVLR